MRVASMHTTLTGDAGFFFGNIWDFARKIAKSRAHGFEKFSAATITCGIYITTEVWSVR